MARQRACDLPRDVQDPLALALLAACEEDPRDEAARAALADRLDELGPTRLTPRGVCPNWMRKAWFSAKVYNHRRFGGMCESVALWMMEHWFEEYHKRYPDGSERYGGSGHQIFDHHGTCYILGRHCFVTEPYQPDRDKLLRAMKRIAQVVGGTPVVCGNSAHGLDRWLETTLIRGLIIPEVGRK